MVMRTNPAPRVKPVNSMRRTEALGGVLAVKEDEFLLGTHANVLQLHLKLNDDE